MIIFLWPLGSGHDRENLRARLRLALKLPHLLKQVPQHSATVDDEPKLPHLLKQVPQHSAAVDDEPKLPHLLKQVPQHSAAVDDEPKLPHLFGTDI